MGSNSTKTPKLKPSLQNKLNRLASYGHPKVVPTPDASQSYQYPLPYSTIASKPFGPMIPAHNSAISSSFHAPAYFTPSQAPNMTDLYPVKAIQPSPVGYDAFPNYNIQVQPYSYPSTQQVSAQPNLHYGVNNQTLYSPVQPVYYQNSWLNGPVLENRIPSYQQPAPVQPQYPTVQYINTDQVQYLPTEHLVIFPQHALVEQVVNSGAFVQPIVQETSDSSRNSVVMIAPDHQTVRSNSFISKPYFDPELQLSDNEKPTTTTIEEIMEVIKMPPQKEILPSAPPGYSQVDDAPQNIYSSKTTHNHEVKSGVFPTINVGGQPFRAKYYFKPIVSSSTPRVTPFKAHKSEQASRSSSTKKANKQNASKDTLSKTKPSSPLNLLSHGLKHKSFATSLKSLF